VFDEYYDDYYYYDEIERPVRYRRPYIRDHSNDYGEVRRPNSRPRKTGAVRRKPMYIERRPYAYDDYDEGLETRVPTIRKDNKENTSVLENRRSTGAIVENQKELVKQSEVSPKVSSGKKLSIYLQPRPPPKFNGKLLKSIPTTTVSSLSKEQNKENAQKNYRDTEQEYEDYVYDDDQNEEPPLYKTISKSNPYQEKSTKDSLDYEKISNRPFLPSRGGTPVRSLKYVGVGSTST